MSWRLGWLLAVVVVVAAVVASWRYVVAEAPLAQLVLLEVGGEVLVSSPSSGPSAPRANQVLGPDDRVQTGAEGRAVLALGPETRVRLGPDATVRVRGVGEEVALELEQGALQATVRPGSQSVRVGSAGRDVVATNADFGVAVGDDGLMVVEASSGSVALAGVSAARVDAGQRAVVMQRTASLGEIPERLLLEVAWPEAGTEPETVVRGRSAPAATVEITGAFGRRVARADAEGAFELTVPAELEPEQVVVRAFDLAGRVVDVQGEIVRRRGRVLLIQGAVEYER